MNLTPYLMLNGYAKEAIEFYEETLGAQTMGSMTFGEAPENPNFPLPPEAKNRIMHAMLKIGDSMLMLSDTFPGQPSQVGDHVTICITTGSKDQSQQVFEALQQGGHVKMPLTETDFSPSYGMVTDKYNVTFHIYTEHKSKQ